MQNLTLSLEGLGLVPYSRLQLLLLVGIQLRRCSHGSTEVHSPVQPLRSFPFTPRSVHDTLFYGIHKTTLYPNKKMLYKGPLHRKLYLLYFIYHAEWK